MDKRQTFEDYKELAGVLAGLWQSQEVASFLVDRDGLTRMQGVVENIEEADLPGRWIVMLAGDAPERIFFDEVIAVNGIFRSDYSEC